MNSYASLNLLKSASYLNIATVTDYDTPLLNLLIQASRLLDKWCGRFFYIQTEIRYYDGMGLKLFLPDDLLAITTLKTDEDGDGTFENTLATTDYFLYPLNDYPKIRIEINPDGDYGSFANGVQKGVEIAGSFGYGDGISKTPYSDSGITVVADNATETELDVSAEGTLAAGHTILVESEQIFIKSATADATKKITVKRAVNGTTGIAHATKAASIYEYPMPIAQGCLITAMRAFKRKDSSYQDIVGSPETGQIITSKGIDPDVAETIKQYRKLRYL